MIWMLMLLYGCHCSNVVINHAVGGREIVIPLASDHLLKAVVHYAETVVTLDEEFNQMYKMVDTHKETMCSFISC